MWTWSNQLGHNRTSGYDNYARTRHVKRVFGSWPFLSSLGLFFFSQYPAHASPCDDQSMPRNVDALPGLEGGSSRLVGKLLGAGNWEKGGAFTFSLWPSGTETRGSKKRIGFFAALGKAPFWLRFTSKGSFVAAKECSSFLGKQRW